MSNKQTIFLYNRFIKSYVAVFKDTKEAAFTKGNEQWKKLKDSDVNLIALLLMTMLITSATGSSGKRNHALRFLFGGGDQSNSFSQLALLKQFLSSSSDGQSSKIDKLFQILDGIAADDKNESSSNKLNRLLGFLNNYGSSSSNNNLNLAMKLINIAQGTGSFSSLSMSDMKSLVKFVG